MTRADRQLLALLYHRSWYSLERLMASVNGLGRRAVRERLASLRRNGCIEWAGYPDVKVRITPAGRSEWARVTGGAR